MLLCCVYIYLPLVLSGCMIGLWLINFLFDQLFFDQFSVRSILHSINLSLMSFPFDHFSSRSIAFDKFFNTLFCLRNNDKTRKHKQEIELSIYIIIRKLISELVKSDESKKKIENNGIVWNNFDLLEIPYYTIKAIMIRWTYHIMSIFRFTIISRNKQRKLIWKYNKIFIKIYRWLSLNTDFKKISLKFTYIKCIQIIWTW